MRRMAHDSFELAGRVNLLLAERPPDSPLQELAWLEVLFFTDFFDLLNERARQSPADLAMAFARNVGAHRLRATSFGTRRKSSQTSFVVQSKSAAISATAAESNRIPRAKALAT
jgi:hypothetical protein